MKVTYLSKMFNPSLKKLPKDSKILSKSQQLLTYYGLISPSSLGTYTIMPTFQRSLDKLIDIINSNMLNVNAEKLTMPSLGRQSIWKTSGRLESIGDEMFRINDLCLQPTHEEEVTSLLTYFSRLNNDQLPILLYQITPKFRNEIAPRSGLLRCREFLMKDLYTFDSDLDAATITYNRVLTQYHSLFNELGLKYMCVEADCGTMGGLLSHEFHIESRVGEDNILKCDTCGKGFNEELKKSDFETNTSCRDLKCSGKLSIHRAIEIGHCFLLGDRYSRAFDLHYFTNDKKRFIMMGCYGIGVTRLLSAAVEVLSTETEIRWPAKLVPFKVALLLQKKGAFDEPSNDFKNALINGLVEKFKHNNLCPSDIIVDDRDVTIGKKLTHTCSIGIPWAIVLKDKDIVETVDVYGGETKYLSISDSIDAVLSDRDDSVEIDAVKM